MTPQDAVARARGLLAKATPGPWHKGVEAPCEESPYGHAFVTAKTAGGIEEPICDCLTEADAELVAAVGSGLLRELCDEVERLRGGKDAAWGVIRSVLGERNRAISFAVHSLDPAAIPFDEAVRQVASGTGLDLDLVEDACLAAPTAEAIAELRGNPWPGHPVMPAPDPAEARLAEEQARAEAASREEESRAKEEGRREAFEAAWKQWFARCRPTFFLRDYLGLTREQMQRYHRTGEIPEGWEPPAGLQEEGQP